MRPSLPRVALTLSLLFVVTRGGSGCAGEQAASEPALDAGTEAAPPRPRADAAGDGAIEYYPEPLAGWDALTDYPWSNCRLYHATAAAAATLAPTWEPCSPVTPSSGSGCRQMKLDWQRPKTFGSQWIAANPRGLRRSPSALSLMLSRGVDGDVVRMIVDAETGAVQSAVREHSAKCALSGEDSSGDYHVYQVYEPDASGSVSSEGGGAIGGKIGEKPRTLFHFDDTVAHSYMAGPPGVVQTQPGFSLTPWNDLSVVTKIVLSPADASLYTTGLTFIGDTLHFGLASLANRRQKVWSLAEGTRDLLTYGNDPTRGYSDLGTDGVDLVWNQGERTDTSSAYPRLSIVTSPYATSTASLTPRVLRSDITGYGFGTSPFVVGCGYAARSTTFEPSPGQFSGGTIVVRLSDGHSWTLPDGDAPAYRWRSPIGITCTELFSLVEVGQDRRWNVARIRLDSLGPPTPP